MRRAVFLAALVLVSCGPKSIGARRVNSQKVCDQAGEELDVAERAMAELDADTAKKNLDDAKKLLKDPDAELYPEFEMLMSRLKEGEAKLPEIKKAKDYRDLQVAITKRKESIEDRLAKSKKAMKELDGANVEKGTVDDVSKVFNELLEVLKDGAELEPKDKPYAEFAKTRREAADKLKEPLALAKARVEFMEGPGALREKAAEKLKAGKEEKASADKRTAFAEAKKLYEQCQDACRKALTANPGISRLPITASGKKTTPEALDTACSAEWQDVDKAEKKIKPDKPVKAPPPPKKKK